MPYSERSNNFACSIVSGCRCTKGSEELEAKQVYANKTMANVVMTYLNYGVFDIQLSNRVIPQVRHGAIPDEGCQLRFGPTEHPKDRT
ncbi:hypothetical protein FoTM2_014740 [Fusarium oxysporum f. sp. vasinfectum]|nr:hypothetical protein FoTM2_014740 [Fusarium oxysporum f. sp. vasinfectum]